MPARLLEFDEFSLDCDRYELLRSGRPVRLEKIPMELLILLVTKDGHLVTRQEIIEHLWGTDVFVDTEHGINTAIRKIRNILRDDPEHPRFVQTIPRKGYRFVATVNVIPQERGNGNHHGRELVPPETAQTQADGQFPSSLPQSHYPVGRLQKAALVLVGAIGIVVILVGLNVRGVRRRLFAHAGEPRIHALAVLPLESLSADQNQDYFADGMTDELITMLAKYSDLRVISRTSVMQYKKAHRPLREIANELGVDGVLEGSVERSGGRVHINAQLVYAPEERHIWAESYDRPLNDLTNLQSDVAQTIARQVGIVATAVPRPVRRINPEAHDAYLWGRYYWFAFRDEEKIRKYFEKAIELQPDYAAAWSGLADTYLGSAVGGISRPTDVVPRGEAAARKALELDDSLPEAHNSMAAAYFCRWDLKNAEQESARTLALNPSFAEGHHLRAYVLQGLNRMDEAVEEERKTVALDPFARPWALVVALLRTRQFDAALTEARLRSQAQPDNADLHLVLSYAYIYKGMDKEAAQEWETSLQLEGDKPSASAMHEAFARGGMNAVYEWQLADLRKQAAAKYVSYENLAILSAKLSLERETLQYLEKAYEEHEPKLVKIQSEPDFDFLHANPRYRGIVRKMGLAPAW